MMEHLRKHNHIIQLLGANEDHHKVYLVMELCEGGELYDRIVNMNFCIESDVATAFKDIIQAVKVREPLPPCFIVYLRYVWCFYLFLCYCLCETGLP